MFGCDLAGMMYTQSSEIPKDYYKSKEYFEKACNFDIADSCSYLGAQYEAGYGVNQDYLMARDLYEKACNLMMVADVLT